MKENPTILRIRSARKRISARFSNSTEKLVNHYINLQKKHKHKLIKATVSSGKSDN